MPFECFLFNSFLALFLFVQIVFWFTYSLYTCLSTNFLIVCFLVCSVMYTIWVCLFVVLRSFVCLLVCLFLFVCLLLLWSASNSKGGNPIVIAFALMIISQQKHYIIKPT